MLDSDDLERFGAPALFAAAVLLVLWGDGVGVPVASFVGDEQGVLAPASTSVGGLAVLAVGVFLVAGTIYAFIEGFREE
jgi:hypothetical protein